MSLVLNVEILGEFKNLTAATQGAQSQLAGLNKKVSSFSRFTSNAFASIGVGLSFAFLVREIGDTIKAASDMEQQFGALDSVYKDQAASMKEFAQNATKMGLSTADAARNAALLGSLLKGSGMEMTDVSKNAKTLTGLAADLAATFGGTAADAVSALGSAFKGEFDPLERFGVSIKKSDVNARMAAEGYTAAQIQTDKLAYSQTLMNMIMEKTTDAQGQAGREADTYAGKMAYLKASFDNVSASIGVALMPVLQQFATWLIKVTPQVQAFFQELINPTTPMGKAWAALGVAFVNFGKTLNSVFAGGKADANGFITVLNILKGTLDAVSTAIKIVSGQYAAEAGLAAGSAVRNLFTPTTSAPTVTKAPVLNTKIPTVNSSSPVKTAPKVTVNVTQAVTAKTIIDTVAAYQKSTGTTLAQALR
jgi:hypothetical protein